MGHTSDGMPNHTFSPEAVELFNTICTWGELYQKRRELESLKTGVYGEWAATDYALMMRRAAHKMRRNGWGTFTTQQILEAALLLQIEDATHFAEEASTEGVK